MIDIKFKEHSVLPWVTAILLFAFTQPYFVWPVWEYSAYLFALPLFGILLLQFRIYQKDMRSILFFVCLTIIAAFCARSNVFGVLYYIMLTLIVFCTPSLLISTYTKFRTIYVSLTLISIIVYILVAIGIPLPYQHTAPLNSLKNYSYNVYPFLVTAVTNVSAYLSITVTARFHGVFDEPGVVGTFSFLLLLIERFDLRKKYNWVLLISGLLSLSLFFYIASAIYAIYYIFVNRKVKISAKLLICCAIALFFIVSYNNEVMNTLIWERMSWNEDTNTIEGNNRASTELKDYYNSIKYTSDYYWGIKDRAMITKYMESASYINSVLIYGIAVWILYFIFFISMAVKKIGWNLNSLLCLMFMFVTLYQRPALFDPAYLFLFATLITVNAKQFSLSPQLKRI